MKTEELAKTVIGRLKAGEKTLATAESCTGGGIGHALTAISGSSAVYLGGVISYTNAVKEAVLGVSSQTLAHWGAVSMETAAAMAEGVCRLLHADYGISVTGLAGPDSDGSGKPVGLVYIGICACGKTNVIECRFSGDRTAVRSQAVERALLLVLDQF